MVHIDDADPIRVTDSEIKKEGDSHLDCNNNGSSTSRIQEPTSAFLDLVFELKKPVDDKAHKTWEPKF